MDKASRCEGLQPSTHPFSEGLLCCCCCGWKEGGQRLGSSDFPQAAVIPVSATHPSRPATENRLAPPSPQSAATEQKRSLPSDSTVPDPFLRMHTVGHERNGCPQPLWDAYTLIQRLPPALSCSPSAWLQRRPTPTPKCPTLP